MIKCMKCKRATTQARGIQLRKSDTTLKGVCMKCYESLTAYRAKRKEKEEAKEYPALPSATLRHITLEEARQLISNDEPVYIIEREGRGQLVYTMKDLEDNVRAGNTFAKLEEEK